MSTIVVVRKGRQACIAADTLTSFDDVKMYSTYDRHHDKIQTCGDSYVGIIGSSAHSLVIDDIFSQSDAGYDLSSRHEIFRSFVRMHAVLKKKYYLNINTKDESNDPYEPSHIDAVIANKNGIFAVYGLRDTSEFTRFWAIGSGSDFALGAMYAVYDRLDSAEEIARIGVAAGIEFNNASAAPITARTVDLVE
ncbi:MAG TPA: MFS transporter [Gammaproteobacteria bacterium]|nr:MFS transporter [Gammaproteobacteria bacterium]